MVPDEMLDAMPVTIVIDPMTMALALIGLAIVLLATLAVVDLALRS